jgi:hypothetical protein
VASREGLNELAVRVRGGRFRTVGAVPEATPHETVVTIKVQPVLHRTIAPACPPPRSDGGYTENAAQSIPAALLLRGSRFGGQPAFDVFAPDVGVPAPSDGAAPRFALNTR